MQTNILDVLTENVQPSATEYSFVIDKDQANNVIGHAKETLEDNGFMVKYVSITAMTAQVIIVRESFEDFFYGWRNYDSALMISAIKKIYRNNELVFDSTSKDV